MSMQRRDFLQDDRRGVGGRARFPAARRWAAARSGKVVVVGGGYGGATAAKYIRMWSDGAVDVTLVEPNAGVHLLPDVEPRARRQQGPRRRHHELRQPRRSATA